MFKVGSYLLFGDSRGKSVSYLFALNENILVFHSSQQISYLSYHNSYDTGLKSPNRRIERLDQILSKSDFLVKGGFSLADVAVASYLLYVIQFFPDVELYSRWPNVVRYMKDCAERDNYAKAFGENVQRFCLQKLNAMQSGEGQEKKKLFGMF